MSVGRAACAHLQSLRVRCRWRNPRLAASERPRRASLLPGISGPCLDASPAPPRPAPTLPPFSTLPPRSAQVISQVRFSDLEVPSDAQVLLATLHAERRARTAPSRHPSTYAQDVRAILSRASQAGSTPAGSCSDACGACAPCSSPTAGGWAAAARGNVGCLRGGGGCSCSDVNV